MLTNNIDFYVASLSYIGHPCGSLLSGLVCDRFGRRKALMISIAPVVFVFAMLGFAESFTVVCIGFVVLSFVFGLKDAPALVYISETRYLDHLKL